MIALTPGYAGYVGGGYGSLNGTRANQMNWQIDGVDNNDLWHNIPAVNQGGVSGIAGIILPIDAVDQFSRADTGRPRRRPQPRRHRQPDPPVRHQLPPRHRLLLQPQRALRRQEPLLRHQAEGRNYNTGFSVGGPFLKDKLFGFLTFEHQRFVIGESGTATEPSVGWQNQAKALLCARRRRVNPRHAEHPQHPVGHQRLGAGHRRDREQLPLQRSRIRL